MPFSPPSSFIIPEDRFRNITVDCQDAIDMAKSIKDTGQLQPVLVRKDMTVIDGATRIRACERLERDVWWEDEETAKLLFENPLMYKVAEYQANFVRKEFTVQQSWDAITQIDNMMREIYGSKPAAPGVHSVWTQRDTAEKLGYKSPTTVSDAIMLSKAVATKSIPELDKIKTTSEAVKLVKKTNQMEAMKEAARRQSERGETGIKNPLQFFGEKLLLGDCLEKMKKLPPKICSIFITDPPFGIELDKILADRGGAQSKAGTTYSDRQDDILSLTKGVIKEIDRVGKPSCQVVMFCGVQYWHHLKRWFEDAGFNVFNKPLLWIKIQKEPFKLYPGRVANPSTHPSSAYEAAIYAWRGDAVLAQQGKPDIFIHPPYPTEKKFHTAQKPIPLMREIINRFYHPGTNPLLIDPFAGSGSTLIAARQVGIQNYFGYEKDPEFRERAVAWMAQEYMNENKKLDEVPDLDLDDEDLDVEL